MNRQELIEHVATQHDLTKAAAGRILQTMLDAIVTSVRKNEEVRLVGFGTFKQVARAARKGFNPSTGTALRIPAAKVPKFSAGVAFKQAVSGKRVKK